jgi:(p)ppGpp synthase/HD superfamily hydrolase
LVDVGRGRQPLHQAAEHGFAGHLSYHEAHGPASSARLTLRTFSISSSDMTSR